MTKLTRRTVLKAAAASGTKSLGDHQANSMLTREYRALFVVPDVV